MSSGRLPPPEPVIELSTTSPVTSLAFSPHRALGEYEVTLYSGHQDGKVIKWNWVTRRPESSTMAHGESIIWLMCVAEKLVSQGRDGVVKFWSVTDPEWTVIGEIPCAALIFCNSSICIFNNQHLLSVPSDSVGQVTTHCLEQLLPESSHIVHLSTPIRLHHKDTKSHGMCMRIKSEADKVPSPYLFVAYESGTLTMWDLLRGEILTEISAHEESIMCMDCWAGIDTGTIKCITGSVDKQLKLWQVDNLLLTHKKTVKVLNPGMGSISVRADGKIIAVGGWDGRCRLFSLKSMKALAVLTFHRSSVQCVAFASNNYLATGSKDGYIAVWNIYNT
ncbi:guanine nucleotide-binding protein subunit beta-like protein 1 [Biomphalaria glabrata]|uniref:Guanine nucleotide-binding protein subunit beta-like protein 1 n=1 Tax=Biomphalaria glabrata TaxID=6526 RepID=A0A9W3A5B2_BIOGL|nr:guanine nucleotide-binding protein subunit beta-like protein 1 [Biomphalaria glabrata]XP_013079464.2 guanine nucleotide-binding protein subunit beta-like protein 1 [Biomphalaria glabrata]XP_013079465.2 guanine nucleotide-binding protein subunit beta-like protein 1 [Biomphalaria glabrata]XP_055882379.1 guanine nucleotide-binding protein subunit beta-like protein 1 [Biomphalaria glabrata]XP_055882382.1 guanine nucleotide-binding protein subunit beta-like protein 1 [Biomphalaria glabrata]